MTALGIRASQPCPCGSFSTRPFPEAKLTTGVFGAFFFPSLPAGSFFLASFFLPFFLPPAFAAAAARCGEGRMACSAAPGGRSGSHAPVADAS